MSESPLQDRQEHDGVVESRDRVRIVGDEMNELTGTDRLGGCRVVLSSRSPLIH
ncbi:MAG: hypothetical protein U5O39_16570 [Gammaproteobacteria bacterium]|nr:hypothetical protein [Gammaproteobacteria bacterium]